MTIKNVRVIRYLRPLAKNFFYSNLGGATFIFDMDYEKRTVAIKFSLAASDDNFNKKTGITVADAAGVERHLDVDKFRKLADTKGGFVDAYLALLETESVLGTVSTREKILLRRKKSLESVW